MSRRGDRLLVTAAALVLIGAVYALAAAGVDYAAEDCAFAAIFAAVVVFAADTRS